MIFLTLSFGDGFRFHIGRTLAELFIWIILVAVIVFVGVLVVAFQKDAK